MTIKYELTKLFKKKEIITVCAVSQDDFNKGKRNTLEYKIGDTWINVKPPFKYKKYSHGICIGCIKEKYPTVYEKLINEGRIRETLYK